MFDYLFFFSVVCFGIVRCSICWDCNFAIFGYVVSPVVNSLMLSFVERLDCKTARKERNSVCFGVVFIPEIFCSFLL